MSLLGWVGAGLLLLAVAGVAAVVVGNRGFDRIAATATGRLAAAASPAEPALDRLPGLVRAYAERTGATGCGGLVRLTQKAEMRLQKSGTWIPLVATQVSSVTHAGFVWSARTSGFPPTRVIDSYVGGEGRLEARLAGLVPVARAAGAATTLGEAMRYLSELPWTPHAIACNSEIDWRDLGGGRVEASMATPAGRAALVYTFDDAGDVAAVTGDRPRADTGTTLPWEGLFTDYRRIGGIRLPRRAEVAWIENGERFTYFRGEILALELVGAAT